MRRSSAAWPPRPAPRAARAERRSRTRAREHRGDVHGTWLELLAGDWRDHTLGWRDRSRARGPHTAHTDVEPSIRIREEFTRDRSSQRVINCIKPRRGAARAARVREIDAQTKSVLVLSRTRAYRPLARRIQS